MGVTRRIAILGLLLLAIASGWAREPIVGGPAEDAAAVFEGLPENLPATSMIAPPSEPGERLVLRGVVRDATGKAAAGVIVYAYHTDDRGIYPRDDRWRGTAAARHGRLRGWAKTDAEGRYEFRTIRPAGYPDSAVTAHIHMHIIEPGRCTYWIDDVQFRDDARLRGVERIAARRARGGNGLVAPRKVGDAWEATRDITLGEAVPGYPPR